MNKKNIESIYPLSPMQQGMLFHSLLAPRAEEYFIQFSTALEGEFNVAAFERAWRLVIERHSILRTAFFWENLKQPLQVVHLRFELPYTQHDWRDLPEPEQSRRLEEFLQEDRARGFDLQKAPLMRLTLIRTAARRFHFVWSFHHLLLDGWSTPLVFNEVYAVYQTLCRGEQPRPEPLPPFRDYIAWLKQQDLDAAETFWRNELRGFTEPTPLGPNAAPRAQGGGRTWGERRAQLSRAATDALQALARQHQLTLYTILQGAWALLLHHYNGGAQDVVFGTTVAGRSAPLRGIEKMVGLFINTLPVRVRLQSDAPLLGWLRELQEHQLEVKQYEYSPLVQVQGWSDVPRGVPLFESLFVFENYPVNKATGKHGGGLDIASPRAFERSNYPLTVTVGPSRELQVRMTYEQPRFADEEVGRMLGHFTRLLESVAAKWQGRVGELSMLSEAERRELLHERSGRQVAYPRDTPIHRLFEEVAAARPDATALESAAVTVSYAELNRRANRLAHHLLACGLPVEARVGVMLERSPELVVALLAVLKAGGSYLPLATDLPSARLDFMLADAGVQFVVTDAALAERLPPTEGLRVLRLDTDAAHIDARHDINPALASSSDALAYVIYTSGSTGTPKGVAVPHRAVTRLVRETDFASFTADETFLLLAPVSFDASTFELWGALLNGARLVIMPPDAPSLAELAEALTRHRVTTLWLTAGLFHLMVDEQPAALRGLRQLLAGGDVLSPSHVERFLAVGDGCELINGYGPTENTTFTCTHRMRAGWQPEGASVPIGLPIMNTRVYVLGAGMELLPAGAVGELYAGGDGLARGYVNDPVMTAERFVPDPFGSEPGARLYRTGDSVRWLADGTLEFLGRLDNQIKLRGFRIELGEIEAALSAHEQVREAAAVVAGEGAERRLVAYVVPADGESVTSLELRRRLAEQLPEYMVPSAFVTLDALPLTQNGKVDRRGLAAAVPEPGAECGAVEGARTATEELVAGLFADVLKVERVGREQSFFELGGHSLLATQVVSRVRAVFGVEIPLRALFEWPTVAGFAAAVDDALRASQQGRSAPPLLAGGREAAGGALPLSFAQQRLWFLDQLEPGSASYNIPAAVRLSGSLCVDALGRALSEVVRRHEALRTTFAVVGGTAAQVIHEASPVPLPLIDLSGPEAEATREGEVPRLSSEEAVRPFDLGRGPLLRATLLKLGAEEHVLLLTMHHIVSDGWSLGVLVKEVGALYSAYRGGGPSPLEELPIQYADYAVWQRGWLRGEVLEEQLDYWRGQLAGAPAVLELPTDRPRAATQTYRGAAQGFTLDAGLTAELRRLSRGEGVTLFMVLLAAYSVLLWRWSGQEDVVAGTPIAGRNRGETEGLIGFFVNTLVLRTRLGGNPTFRELLGRVREVCLGAYAHQDVPFEKLVEELQPERSLSHTPLFQVMLVLQNTPQEAISLPGLSLSSLNQIPEAVRCDLTLAVAESAERLEMIWRYASNLFEPSTIERMQNRFETLLRQVVAQPETRIDSLELTSAAEREQEAQRERAREELSRRKFMKVSPKAVRLSKSEL